MVLVTWFKIDDAFWSHPKTMKSSPTALALFVRAGSYAAGHLTDGVIEETVLPLFGPLSAAAEELVGVGYWEPHEKGFLFHDWADYQPSKEEIEARRQQDRQRKQEWRERRGKRSAPEPQPLALVPPPTRSVTKEFDEAWARWPKKVNRKKAFDKFKIKTRSNPNLVADIIRFGDAYASTTERQFVPGLDVWLNGERWTDELPTRPMAPGEKPPTQPTASPDWSGRTHEHRFDVYGMCIKPGCDARQT